jgi:8-oxo-dGTP diphosphatase
LKKTADSKSNLTQTRTPSANSSDPLNPPSTVRAVLCYISRSSDGKFLLLRKAKGKFGEGFWNAPGGKIEVGEEPDEAARREAFEETGLRIRDLINAGYLEFYFGQKKRPDWTAEVFKTSSYNGRAKKRSEEGVLRWFDRSEFPFERMWEDDRHWLPLLISGIRFRGSFEFTADSKKLLRYNIVRL